MFNPFQPLQMIKTEVFMSMPAKFRKKSRTAWSDPIARAPKSNVFSRVRRSIAKATCGSSTFRSAAFSASRRKKTGNSSRNTTAGRTGSRSTRTAAFSSADYKEGLLALDPKTGKLETVLRTAYSEGFKGLNDLHFAANGDLYFTDQGQTGIADPTGRVYRLDAKGRLDRLCDNVPSPNGITLSTTDKHVYVGVTRSQQIWRLPLMADGTISKTGVAIQLSGGVGGPDGIEMDCRKRPARMPARRRHLALRRQHAADASDLLGRPQAPSPREHRVRRPR